LTFLDGPTFIIITTMKDESAKVHGGRLILGSLFLALSAAMSLMLVLDHFGGISLPGCGVGSPCAKAAASAWGRLPGTSWPVSFVGLAYFTGMLLAWLLSGGGVPSALRAIARIGVLVSVMYVIAIGIGGYGCWYCVAAHAGNFAFWIILELTRISPRAPARPIGALAGVFVCSSVILGAAEWSEQKSELEKRESDLAKSTSKIIEATSRQAVEAAATEKTPAQQAQKESRPWQGGFTGRYRYGPEKAPIRIVMMSDYQCVDCYRIENDVKAVLDRYKDVVSLSAKHFPMCKDCNDHFQNNNMHPNACWAARAAEAAGILKGNDGFWQMHFWLFEHRGTFTNEELTKGLTELGYNPQEFINVMTSAETLRRVKGDVEEGIWLGLHYTPMIFINGVELFGVFAPNAVGRAVEALAAKNPPAMTCELDQPPPAATKMVRDWEQQPFIPPPTDRQSWARGPADAKVKVTMWGDYQEPNTAAADAIIRKFAAGGQGAHYSFRHYPVNQSCNPECQVTKFPNTCRAHAAAEAAGAIGGLDAYWKMHQWLMSHQADFSEESLKKAAGEMGLDAAAFFKAMDSQEVRAAISEDEHAAKTMGLTGVPHIVINGQYVPRFGTEGKSVLDQILERAASSKQ
jgi:protein-disulfide isomerase/uncharacterized membrane protein